MVFVEEVVQEKLGEVVDSDLVPKDMQPVISQDRVKMEMYS